MSLLLHYKFDQSNLLLDSSGNSLDLDQYSGGSITTATDPTYGTVAYFDGSSGARLSSMPTELQGNSPRTFSIWAKRDSIEYQFLYNIGVIGVDDEKFQAYLASTDALAILKYGDSSASTSGGIPLTTSPPAFTVGAWSHIVATYDGTTFSGYVNGVLIYSTDPDPLVNTPPGGIEVGYRQDDRDFLTGNLSDFRVYDDALNATEVSFAVYWLCRSSERTSKCADHRKRQSAGKQHAK